MPNQILLDACRAGYLNVPYYITSIAETIASQAGFILRKSLRNPPISVQSESEKTVVVQTSVGGFYRFHLDDNGTVSEKLFAS